MENRRFMLIAFVGVVLFFIYQAWQKDHAGQPAAAVPTEAAAAPAAAPSAAAAIPGGEGNPVAATAAATPEATAVNTAAGARIRVQTDKLNVEISLTGGELRRVELVGYPVAKNRPNDNLALLDDSANHWFVLQSGLATPQQTLTSPQTVFTSAQASYTLAPGADSVDVPLEYTDASGYTVLKTYRFKRGSYDIVLDQQIKNAGGAALNVSPYVQLRQTPSNQKESSHFGGIHTFDGIAYYEQKSGTENYRFEKTKFEDLHKDPVNVQQKGGWLAMLQHYFIAVIIPPAGESNTLSAKPGSTLGYLAQYVGSAASVAPRADHTFSTQVYLGPVLQKTIGAVAPGLDLAVDYGLLSPVATLLFWVMNFFHQLTHNWGVAIILLTLLVRGLMYPLSEKQYRSMAKMKKFAPRIAELKERYAGDRERMSKAMMELYKKEGFNPLAGCWPLVIQFPVFLSLYWVLLDSVELRQAPFMLWINDLSAADPSFVLPVLFGISMFLQQRLSGTQVADPMQQRVMQMMPILMAAFFAFFPSGLVLYYVVSNATGITQQWLINRKLEKEGLGRSPR
ncbi:MAG: membrane protein insertase YidC [Stenotrophobium sp.]